jgi:phosphatidate cytidylyltransferase
MEAADSRISNMIRRRITGIVIAVVMIALWLFQGWPLRVGLVALMILSMWEMYGAFVARGAKPIRWVGLTYATLTLPVYLWLGVSALSPLATLFCMLALAGVILRGQIDFDSAVATLFPLFYPGMLITMLYPLQDLQPVLVARVATALMLLIPLMTDLFAYEFGTHFGKHKLSPALSPNKSVEGAVAGILAAAAFSVVVPFCAQLVTSYVPQLMPYAAHLPPLWAFLILGLVGSFAAQIGDLTASMVKRYCGIKDYGSIFPGHGGMLDRMDSVLFAGVILYVFFTLPVRW